MEVQWSNEEEINDVPHESEDEGDGNTDKLRTGYVEFVWKTWQGWKRVLAE